MLSRKMRVTLFLSVFFSFFAMLSAYAQSADSCGMCGKPLVAGSVVFEITYADGKKEAFGCPGCGLSMMKDKKVKSASTTDFLSREIIDAKSAYYLKGTEVGTCCEPHWLSFKTKSDAEKFSKGFGGRVLSYEQAIQEAHAMHH